MSYQERELVAVEYDEIVDHAETKAAYLFIIDGEERWLPKSQVEDILETANQVIIPRWLANKKGLKSVYER